MLQYIDIPAELCSGYYGGHYQEKSDEYFLQEDSICILHSNIDDSSGEQLGSDFIDGLLATGAKDVTLSPCIMKKGRPGQHIEVLCDHADSKALASYIMCHSSSIGVRYSQAQRYILEREFISVTCRYGEVQCKKVVLPNGLQRCYPEYSDCAKLAKKNNLAVIVFFPCSYEFFPS